MTQSIFAPVLAFAARQPDKLLYVFMDGQGRTTESYTYAQLVQRTTDIAVYVQRSARLSPGDRVLLVYPPGIEIIAAFFACVRLGLVPVPVYPPSSHGFGAALEKMNFIARDCQAAAVLTQREYYWSMMLNRTRQRIATLSWQRDDVSRLKWLVSSDADVGSHVLVDAKPSEVLFLQYTSGSTSEPKGVMVSHANMRDNCEAVVDHLPVGVSWLPQYHDMGLIGYYVFFAMKGGTTYGFSPMDFIERPLLWLQTITRYRGTASSAPNFAYEYCLREDKVPEASLAELDLSSLRFLMTAAEPVRADVYRRFLARFGRCGLQAQRFFAAYGLAENTLAVSNYGRAIMDFDSAALRQHRVAAADPGVPAEPVTTLVSCGRVVAQTEVAIVATAGEPRRASADQVGEIWIRGPSKCQGYWHKPTLTAEVFHARLAGEAPDGEAWLRSGDLGFLHGGELYICGRSKDLIIIRGENFYPQDIETVVQGDSHIRRGCVAAFAWDHEGREQLVVVAEVKHPQRLAQLDEINHRLAAALGIAVQHLVLVQARTIAKTSSGKIARHLVRDRWLQGKLQVVATLTVLPDQDDEAKSSTLEARGAQVRNTASPQQPTDLRQLLRRYRLSGDETCTLTDAGLDSLRLVEFSHDFKFLLQHNGHQDLAEATQLSVLQRLAVCELVALTAQLSTSAPKARLRFLGALANLGEELQALERELMLRDAHLRIDICDLPAPELGSERPCRGVLLTGGTGFFGPFLLASLLRQRSDEVFVLVRAADRTAGLQRLLDGLQSIRAAPVAELEVWAKRLVPVCGDLALSQFGLSDGQWRDLACSIHSIYHNGAMVNYVWNYQRMRDANVGGTREAVRLAMSYGRKPLNLISTTFIFGWSVQDTLRESDTNSAMDKLDFGYSQSKWVAEQLVYDAMRQGLNARVFRPALLTPSLGGGAPHLDIAIRLLAFMLQHGLTTTAQNQVSFSRADGAADNIVAIAEDAGSLGGTFHVTRDDFATLGDVTALMSAQTGRRFESLELSEFVPEVIARCRPGDVLFPLLEFLVRSVDNITAMEFKRYDNSAYRAARDSSPRGRADPPLEDVVAGILQFMEQHGLTTALQDLRSA